MQRFGDLPSDGQGFVEWDRALSDPVLEPPKCRGNSAIIA